MLSAEGKTQHKKDRQGLSSVDPGPNVAVDEAVAWVCRAQDYSASQDGGVACCYSLLRGWGVSYPETTGYIIPTIIEYAKLAQNELIIKRAKRMLDWLVSIQMEDGGFTGGQINSKFNAPVTFNTGQILFGFTAGVHEFGDKYLGPMLRAADWLVKTQDAGGCWRSHPSPYTIKGEKTYDTHIAWALLEASKIEDNKKYVEAAIANVDWALKLQTDNGWFAKCCVSDPIRPLTHTLGYVFRGVLETYQYTQNSELLDACIKIADGLLSAASESGHLPGRLLSNWQGAVQWSCLTGSVQIAICWLKMYYITGNIEYRKAAYAVNRYVRRTMKNNGPPETRGAIGGSFPIYGEYCQYDYPNWACKFFIDANILEIQVRERDKISD